MLSHAGAGNTLFNVPSEQLKTILEAAVGRPVQSFAIVGSENIDGFQGYAAEKVLPIFEYRLPNGDAGRITLFVKRMYGLDVTESRQYRFLKKRNIPTPRIFGEATGTKGEEIIFFEKLDAIGINDSDPREVRAYVGVLARINALRPEPDDTWRPGPHVVARDLTDGKRVPESLEAVWRHAQAGELGDEIRAVCSAAHTQLDALSRISVELGTRLADMPRALLYEDYAPRNSGWRNGRTEFVTFDVHRLSIGPRFWDLAGTVGRREDRTFPSIPWEELVEFYLETHQQYGGARATVADVERETALIRAANSFFMFPWMLHKSLTGEVDWTPDREEGRRSYRKGMLGTLQTVLEFKLP